MQADGTCKGQPAPKPATEPDIVKHVEDKAKNDPTFAPKIADAARKDVARNPNLLSPSVFWPKDLPVDSVAPPVTGPKVRKQNDSVPNTDGSVTTITMDQQTTVTPTQKGSTAGDFDLQFIPSTTTTTTTTNSNTGQSTTTTSTETEQPSGGGAPGQSAEGPKECGSPGRPKCQIDETGTPDAQATKTMAEQAINDAGKPYDDMKNVIAQVNESQINRNWLPSIPTAACVNPKVEHPLTGQAFEVPYICSTVDLLRSVIGLVTAFLGIVGAVRQVEEVTKS